MRKLTIATLTLSAALTLHALAQTTLAPRTGELAAEAPM